MQVVAFLFVLPLKLYGKGKGRGVCGETDGNERLKERKIERGKGGRREEKVRRGREKSESETGRMSERVLGMPCLLLVQ